jgi:hypothetical protein
VIPSDDDDERGNKATSMMPTKPRKGGRTMPVGKTLYAGRTAPGKAANLRLRAASNKTRAVARAGMPTATHLTMDDNDKDVDVAMTIERGLAMATALGNDRIIGGPAPAGKTLSTQYDGAREGRQATHWGGVRRNEGGREGRNTYGGASYDGQR